MTNGEARKRLKMPFNDNPRLYFEAIEVAVKALEKLDHLIDRPCEACEYHKETGCSKWSCVFEAKEGEKDDNR